MSDWPVTISILRDATLNGVLYGGGVGVATSVTAAPATGNILSENAGIPAWKAPSALNLAVTTGNLSQFAATTSAQLAGIISDETGSGSLVFATSPTFVTPILGVASATSLGIGTVSLQRSATVNIKTTNVAGNSNTYNLYIETSDAQAINIGGCIGLGGQIGGDSNAFGAIAGRKSNNTSANYDGYLAFYTNKGGNELERLRIDADGNVGINLSGAAAGGNLAILGTANQVTVQINGSSTTSQSYGLRIDSGTNASDLALSVRTQAGTVLFTVRGDNAILFGATATISFYGATAVGQQTSAANLTNNVTSGGTNDTIADFTSLTVYATDAAAIRNDIYQLARKLKQINDGLRSYGLFT